MSDNGDGGRRVGLNGEQECFSGYMGTHNGSTISSVDETGKKTNVGAMLLPAHPCISLRTV
jgi:hypothetical protein